MVQSQKRPVGLCEAGRGGARALDAEKIVAAALKSAGRGDFADRCFYQPLQRLIASCNAESDLNALGRHAVRHDIRRSLKNLLELERRERESPSILSRPIERPIFIPGMPRSGSTLLHRLLVQDPRTAAPLSWQLVYPYPCRTGRLGAALRRAGVQAQFYLMRWLAPERAAQRMQKWLGNRSNRHHRQGAYQLANFGLDPDVLRAQFAPYTDRFGIELEWKPGGRAARTLRT